MKKRFLILPLILLATLFLLPISPSGTYGYYNFASNAFYCNSARGCRHEIAHRMDAENGHPSRSFEFSHAVELYLYVSLHYDYVSDFTMAILTYPPMMNHRVPRFPVSSSAQEELYADMYAWVDGDVGALPEIFRPFYSTDRKYMDLYDCLMSAPVRLCGLALHVKR